MRTEQRILHPIEKAGGNQPLHLAQIWYGHYSDVAFVNDLAHYLEHGVVISTPVSFGMAKIINVAPHPEVDPPVPAWFVRFASGNLEMLLDSLPAWLDTIAFCRNNDGRIRTYKLRRMIALARKIKKKPRRDR